MTIRLGTTPDDLERAARVLRDGGLVAFPTETVYGLGADASDDDAVRGIFEAKERPADHPLIVHLPDSSHLDGWARDVPAVARALAGRFWPGPLTLILRRAEGVPDVVTGGQDTVGLRVPGHPVALALLRAFGGGVAAPSANRFGRVSPTTADHVASELGGRIDAIVDGGACSVGLESTILDLTGDAPAILRPGRISADELAEVAGPVEGAGRGDAPRVPGSKDAHYAPSVPVRLVGADDLPAILAESFGGASEPAVLVRTVPLPPGGGGRWWRLPPDPARYGRALYATLREAEASGCPSILVERPPDEPRWAAVLDRLRRAAHGAGPPAS